MSWAKLCDQMDIDPDLLELHPDAFAYFVGTITYSARNLTDGFLKACHAPDILRFKGRRKINVARAIKALTDGGFLECRPGGWQIRNYLKFNPSCAQVETERQRKANKQRRYRERLSGIIGGSGDCEHTAPQRYPVTGLATNPAPVPVPDPKEIKDPLPSAQRVARSGAAARLGSGPPPPPTPEPQQAASPPAPPGPLAAPPSAAGPGPEAKPEPRPGRLTVAAVGARGERRGISPPKARANAQSQPPEQLPAPEVLRTPPPAAGEAAASSPALTKHGLVDVLCRELNLGLDVTIKPSQHKTLDAVVAMGCTYPQVLEGHAEAVAYAAGRSDTPGIGLVLLKLKSVVGLAQQEQAKAAGGAVPAGAVVVAKSKWQQRQEMEDAAFAQRVMEETGASLPKERK